MIRNKILYIIPSWFTFYYQLLDHIRFLKSRGFEVEVASENNAQAVVVAETENICFYNLNLNTKTISPAKDLKTLFYLARLIKQNDYKIVFCCTKKGGLLTALAAKQVKSVQLVYNVRGIRGLDDTITGFLKSKIFTIIEKTICRLADWVLFVSKSNSELFNKKLICQPKKMKILGKGSANGVNIDNFRKTESNLQSAKCFRETHGISDRVYVFGYVGKLELEKGIKELANAWRLINKKHNNIHLIIISPPEIDPDVSNAIKKLKQYNNVHFIGFMHNPTIGYAAMDCLVLPTYNEGFPTVILEAGSMELPVIASRTYGCTDAIIDGITGHLVAPRNAEALAQGMERILSNKDEGLKLGKNARKRCEEFFRQELVWQSFADFYTNLVNK
jgi:glycosyltransferase involved in cell wall biosynthesis